MSYGVHRVFPPGFREGPNSEKSTFFKGKRRKTSGGSQISDISLDHPEGNAISVPKIVF